MNTTITGYYSRIRYFTTPWERMGEALSSVLGGCGNQTLGNYSAILGGSGNNDNGFNYVGIFGQNIGGVAANTFHVNCLNACSTPCITASAYPAGTIGYITAGTTIPPGAKALYII